MAGMLLGGNLGVTALLHVIKFVPTSTKPEPLVLGDVWQANTVNASEGADTLLALLPSLTFRSAVYFPALAGTQMRGTPSMTEAW
jgi:hypothetical protein